MKGALVRMCTLLLVLFALSGCVARSYVALMSDAEGVVGSVTLDGEGEGHTLTQQGQGMAIAAGARRFSIGELSLRQDFAALAARPTPPERFVLYFKPDDRSLTLPSDQMLDSLLYSARQREYPMVAVIGHTDSLGYKATNMRVGLERARLVAEMLRARGLDAVRLQVESHGELDLLIDTPDATAHERNRRVEVVIR